jgi:hypothetical protein
MNVVRQSFYGVTTSLPFFDQIVSYNMDENESTGNKMVSPLNKKRSRSTDIDEENQQVLQIANGVRKVASQKQNLAPIKQYESIKQILAKGNDGKPEYMLARHWYVYWEKYCLGLTSVLPSGIDNSTLLLEDGSLRPNLTFDEDYVVMPENAWLCLVRWY